MALSQTQTGLLRADAQRLDRYRWLQSLRECPPAARQPAAVLSLLNSSPAIPQSQVLRSRCLDFTCTLTSQPSTQSSDCQPVRQPRQLLSPRKPSSKAFHQKPFIRSQSSRVTIVHSCRLHTVLQRVCTLVVINTAFHHTCLRLLVSTLLRPPAPPSPEANFLGPWQPSEEEAMVQAAVTGALSKVLHHVSTTPTSLMQLVSAHLPHEPRHRSTQCLYFSSLFRLAETQSGGQVRDAVLARTVEHLLSLSVDIRWEDIVIANTGRLPFACQPDH